MPALLIDVEARTAAFFDSLEKIKRDTGRTADSMQKAFAGANAALGAIGVTLSAGAIVGGFKAMVTNAINAADEFNKMSQKIGIGVESLSRLSYAADLADVSQESLQTGIKKLSVNMFEAASGSKEAAAGFDALGINVKNSSGQLKSSDQILNEIADRFERIEDGAGKTALAVRLFGRAGQEMIPLLNQGSAGMKQLADEADRLGLTISSKTAAAAEAFNDNLKRLGTGSRALGLDLAEKLLPTLSRIVEEFLLAKQAAGGLFELIKINAGLNPFKDVGTHINEAIEALDKLKAKRVELSAQSREGFFTKDDIDKIDREIAANKKLLEVLRARQLATVNRLPPGTRDEVARFGGELAKEKAPLLPENEKIKAAKDMTAEFERQARLQVEGEEQAAKDTAEAWKAWEEIQKQNHAEFVAAKLTQDQQVLKNIDDQRERDEEAMRVAAGIGSELKKTNDIGKELGLTFASAVGELIKGGGEARDIFKALALDVVQLIAKMVILEPIAKNLKELFDGFGKKSPGSEVSGNLFSGIGDFLKKLVGGSFASGIDSVPHDMLAMVHKGERIIPAAENTGSMGGTYYIDARNSDRAGYARLEEMILRLHGSIEHRAVSAVAGAKQRGGAFSSVFAS